MRKLFLLFLGILFIPIGVYAQAVESNKESNFPLYGILFVVFFSIIYASQRHEGKSFGEDFMKCALSILGGFFALYILFELVGEGEKKVNEVSKTEFVSNFIGRNYVEFTSSSVIIDVPYPKIGVSSTYGIDYPKDFNLKAIEKDIFHELRKDKYDGVINIKVRSISKGKYGYEEKENPVSIGTIEVREIKKYKNYSSYRPQIAEWVTNYLRNKY